MNGEVDPPFRPQHPIPDPNDFPTSPGRVGARSCCHGRTARPECVLPRSFQGRHGPQSVSGAYAADPSVPSSADRFRLRHNLHGLHPDLEHPISHSQRRSITMRSSVCPTLRMKLCSKSRSKLRLKLCSPMHPTLRTTWRTTYFTSLSPFSWSQVALPTKN